ncbi:hypothetical protein B484DRAFT_394635 [Ochromonadaceae sp. CCMP2298]|nr:hypothetical protein B484DRAFT_394635 [Ochromonadaceae sp. CCMP2298]
MQIRVLLVAAVLCNAVGFQFMPRLGRRFALSLSEAGGVGGDENGDGEVERSGVGTDEKLGDLISSIVSSFKNGTSVQKGFVTSTGRSLDVKILDPDIQADIWSGYTTDDAEVLAINALMEASKLQLGGVGADTDTDTGKEARETMREIRDDRVGEAEEEAAVAAAVAEAVQAQAQV